jgi:hypothetical protein
VGHSECEFLLVSYVRWAEVCGLDLSLGVGWSGVDGGVIEQWSYKTLFS